MFDVLIIGGGVVGSACARELARYRLKTGVLEKNLDVVNETSGRNSGVVHGGFAYDTGTLKAKLCVEGNRMMDELAEELDFPFIRCGKVLVGNTDEDRVQLNRTIEQGYRNGASNLFFIGDEELHRLVPIVIGKFAMLSKNSGIVDPFQYTVALAENAAENGVEYFFDREVTGIDKVGEGEDLRYLVHTVNGDFETRWVINAAGLGCGKISDMLGITGYRVIGSKGSYIILDERTGKDCPMPVYPVPSNTYMGIHVTNTIDGNVIVGPNAIPTENFEYYGVPAEDIVSLAESANLLWPGVFRRDYIRNYSGILPKWVDENGVIQDFKIEIKDNIAPHAVNLVGIESPGLTAAVPIARYVIGLMQQREEFEENPDFEPRRKGIRRFAKMTDEEKAEAVANDPDYGEVICRCEKVTRAEILQAIHNPLGVSTMTGIKYRTRTMMGRCQGGYCQMRLEKMIEEELGKKPEDVVYERKGSNVLFGTLRPEGGENAAAACCCAKAPGEEEDHA
ncbi:MAG: NAD(P)/FAD-dependent oxidoreductase [Lachnospiraceae bacterium]|nr:NAD(P)/FAD-dependent oxidoreductase [Lachnospiraceae bacterium]